MATLNNSLSNYRIASNRVCDIHNTNIKMVKTRRCIVCHRELTRKLPQGTLEPINMVVNSDGSPREYDPNEQPITKVEPPREIKIVPANIKNIKKISHREAERCCDWFIVEETVNVQGKLTAKKYYYGIDKDTNLSVLPEPNSHQE